MFRDLYLAFVWPPEVIAQLARVFAHSVPVIMMLVDECMARLTAVVFCYCRIILLLPRLVSVLDL